MKNGLLIWNLILTLVAGYLVVTHFTSNSKKKSTIDVRGPGPAASGEFRMAYFEMDSVSANYQMVKEVRAELTRKEEEHNGQIDALAKKLQQRYMYFQNLAKDGKLSDAQKDSASEELRRMDEDIKARKQELDQEYNNFMAQRQNDIKARIETFLKDYNKDRNFSYIVSYEQGLFYFKDTAYNITADVIKGLNESYKASAKR
jgi:outer membrane protein